MHALNNIIRKCFYLPYLLLYPELQQMAFNGAGEEVKGNNNNSCVVCVMKCAHYQSYHIYQACTSWTAKLFANIGQYCQLSLNIKTALFRKTSPYTKLFLNNVRQAVLHCIALYCSVFASIYAMLA